MTVVYQCIVVPIVMELFLSLRQWDYEGKTYHVIEISSDAFKNNRNITEVTISGSVKLISDPVIYAVLKTEKGEP